MDLLIQEMNGSLLVVLPEGFSLSKNETIEHLFAPIVARDLPLTLDISNVDYIDSAGLSTLLWLNRKTPRKLKLINLSPHVKHVIGLCEVAQFFEFGEGEDPPKQN